MYGNVEFAEGGNLFMEFTDIEPGELKVNDPIRFVYRIKDDDRMRGFRRYFWKATKVSGALEAHAMASGIKDKVVIVGMGCSRFGERWSSGPDDLMIEAFEEALADAGMERDRIEAAWLGVFFDEQNVGKSSLPLSMALRLPNVPVTQVENLCATGTEAFRGAVYAVAAGACDIALAHGRREAEGHGLRRPAANARRARFDDLYRRSTAPRPAVFAQLASRLSRQARRIRKTDLKRAMAHVSCKSHENGAQESEGASAQRASPRNRCSMLRSSPIRSACSTAAACRDGAACAIVTTPDIARALGKRDLVTVQGAAARAVATASKAESPIVGRQLLPHHAASRREARLRRGRYHRSARRQIALIEVHDCFSITELVTDGGSGHCPRPGRAPHDVMDGFYDADGAIPCQIDGGLKCFGHPIGASGLRMVYEIYLQLLGRAGDRQTHGRSGRGPSIGLTHNLGGIPNRNIASVSILGLLAA